MEKLTVKQQEIVEKNHNLIYSFINKKQLDEAEYYGLIAECLMRAVVSHDESKGKLSTLFFRIATGRLRNNYDTKNTLKFSGRNKEINLIENEYVNSKVVVSESCDVDIDGNLIVEDFLSTLSESDRAITLYLMDGYPQEEIAKMLSKKRPHISRRVKSIRQALRGVMG